MNFNEALKSIKGKKNLNEVKELLEKSSEAYYNSDEVILTDEQYDKLYSLYQRITGDVIVGAIPPTGTKEVNVQHNYEQLVGTLYKAQSLEDSINEVHKIVEKNDEDTFIINLSLKFDGNSITNEYDKNGNVKLSLTRGKNGCGADKTICFKDRKVNGIFKTDFAVKYEAIILYKDYEKICNLSDDEYANPRSLISGLLGKNDNYEFSKYFTLVPLELRLKDSSYPTTTFDGVTIKDKDCLDSLYDNNKETNYYSKYSETRSCNNEEEINTCIEEYYDYVQSIRQDLEFMIDGIVVEFLNKSIIDKMGYDNLGEKPKHSFALKLPRLEKIGIVTDIDYPIGSSGRITPRIWYTGEDGKPIVFNGCEMNKQQISSYKRFKELNLGLGSRILVSYNNDCLSYISKINCPENEEIKPFKFIKRCPICNSDIVIRVNDKGIKTIASCPNEECDARVIGKINNFLVKMDIKGTKENTLEKIYNEGLMTTIKDLFTMDYNDVSNVVGEKTALNLKKAVESKTYFDYEILGSLMIDGIGIESSKVIMKNYTIDDIIDMKKKSVIIENISQLEGFSKIKAKSFAEGLIQNIKLIKFLKSRKENYKVLKDVLKENNVSSVDSMKIVFTGFRDPALQNKLEMMGHKVTSSVSGKTSILVHNGDPGATKIEAAKKNGTKIMMLNEFKKFMNIE